MLSAAAAALIAGTVVAPQAFGATAAGFGGTGDSRFSGFFGRDTDTGGGTSGGGGTSTGGGTSAGGCAEVHIIATRASTERPGAGIIGSLVTAVQQASDQSVSTDTTDYPATLSNYSSSVARGVAALTEQVTTQAADCPESKIVLLGYSQGAHVIGDVLAGSGRAGPGRQTAPLDDGAAERVAAVVLMGDPRFVPNKPFNAGTSTRAGRFPRGADAALDPFAEVLQSYCDTDDTFCAGGGNLNVHLGYTRRYNDRAEAFVLDRIGG